MSRKALVSSRPLSFFPGVLLLFVAALIGVVVGEDDGGLFGAGLEGFLEPCELVWAEEAGGFATTASESRMRRLAREFEEQGLMICDLLPGARRRRGRL